MEKEEIIKDFYGNFLGYLITKDNGDQVAKSFPSQQILGYYRKDSDITTDFYGRLLTRGNTVISLIMTK